MSESLLRIVVQGTLIALVVFSVATWALVLVKGVQSFRLTRLNAKFRSVRGNGLPSAERLRTQTGPEARLTQLAVSTWQENESLVASNESAAKEVLELRLRQQIQRERRATENGLAVLATIGTTSPFVGLFGTVWGIMGALTRIGETGEAGIEVVAGPIGEALIATGFGIAVAVPAVIAFNVFVRRLKVQLADLEDLAQTLVAFALQGKLETTSNDDERDQLSVSGSIPRPSEIVDVARRHQEASA
jgi:biopolymer transport protein ExbB